MQVVLRSAGHRRRDAAVEIAAGGGVGVPELVFRIFERFAVVRGRGVEADRVHHVGERHFDVEVVLVDGVGELVALDVAFDDLAIGLEFGGGAVGDADHLCGPSAADFVAQHFAGEVPVRDGLSPAT